MNRISLDHADVKSQEDPCHKSKEQTVRTTNLHLLHNQHQLLLCCELLIHQDTDRNSQRLCSDVSCHVEDQGLEAHDDRDHGYDRLKCADNRGDDHSEE